MTAKKKTTDNNDEAVLLSWKENAVSWIETLKHDGIPSRTLVTNAAIIESVLEIQAKTLLDIGCGEGWLVRLLSAQGVSCLGIDAVSALIEHAEAQGEGRYQCLAMEDCRASVIKETFDCLVCNFSLLGKESVEQFLRDAPTLLSPDGQLLIQTIHPVSFAQSIPYQDSWQCEDWSSIRGDYVSEAPWYFRTLGSWVRLITDSGFLLTEVKEPLNPETEKPASMILRARCSS